MQITESGVTTATNVENSENLVLCKSSNNVQDSLVQPNASMAETANLDSGADTASEVVVTKESVAVGKSEGPKSCSENLEVEINNLSLKANGLEENICEGLNGSGAELGILDQTDTTSVENLSIVTVVEKELESGNEALQNAQNQEYTHGNGRFKSFHILYGFLKTAFVFII